MNIKWIYSFMKVAETGSITSAAKELYISPQALMQQINLLEEDTKIKLFIRSHKGMRLSLAGKEFLRGAKQMENIYNQTLSRCHLASKAENMIRIPMMSSIILPRFMESVCAEYRKTVSDHMDIRFVPDTDFDYWMEHLIQLKYDLLECYTIDKQCPKGIHFEPMRPLQSWCVMSYDHPLIGKSSICPEDFESYTLLAPGMNLHLLRYLQIYFESHNIKVQIESIKNDRYPIFDGIINGGIYLTNKDIANEFKGFYTVPLDFDTHVWLGLACREEMISMYQPIFEIAHKLCG